VEEKHIKPEMETNTQSNNNNNNNNNNYIHRNLSCNFELINVKYKCLERIILIIIQFNSTLYTQYFLLIYVLTPHPNNNNNNNYSILYKMTEEKVHNNNNNNGISDFKDKHSSTIDSDPSLYLAEAFNNSFPNIQLNA
jgi:hypothetical protein